MRQRAKLLVVGSRGHGRISGALLGTVNQYLDAHAACPVVVIKPLANQHGRRSRRTQTPLLVDVRKPYLHRKTAIVGAWRSGSSERTPEERSRRGGSSPSTSAPGGRHQVSR